MYEFSIFANWSGSSLWRTSVLGVRPWLKAFIELVARPWGVFGPRDFAPLILADSALVRFDISLETLFTAEARRRREKRKNWYRAGAGFRLAAAPSFVRVSRARAQSLPHRPPP